MFTWFYFLREMKGIGYLFTPAWATKVTSCMSIARDDKNEF